MRSNYPVTWLCSWLSSSKYGRKCVNLRSSISSLSVSFFLAQSAYTYIYYMYAYVHAHICTYLKELKAEINSNLLHAICFGEEKLQRSDRQLSKRLASFGIMRVWMRVPVKPLIPTQHLSHWGVQGGPLIVTPLCRRTQASRTGVVIFARVHYGPDSYLRPRWASKANHLFWNMRLVIIR